MSGYSVFINLRWLFTGEGNPIIEETYYESELPIIKGEMTEEQAQAKLKAVKAAKIKTIYFMRKQIIVPLNLSCL